MFSSLLQENINIDYNKAECREIINNNGILQRFIEDFTELELIPGNEVANLKKPQQQTHQYSCGDLYATNSSFMLLSKQQKHPPKSCDKV